MAALDPNEVLENLQKQLVTNEETRLKLIGAIDVLQQIEESKAEPEPEVSAPEPGTVEVVEDEGGE